MSEPIFVSPYILSCSIERSRNAAAKAVQVVLELEDRQRKLREALKKAVDPARVLSIDEITQRMDEEDLARAEMDKVTRRLERARTLLGVADVAELKRLKGSEYLTKVVNAKALKIRIRTRVIERKFELTRMERACITSKPGEHTPFVRAAGNAD